MARKGKKLRAKAKKAVINAVAQQVAQKVVRGKGDYTIEELKSGTPIKTVERRLDRLENRLVGNTVGAKVLNAGANLYDTIFGSGDYTVRSNSIMTMANQIPNFRSGGRETRIQHKEYLLDVVTGAANAWQIVASFSINPGLLSTFPWLCSIAANYEEYELHGIVFFFETTSASWSGTGQNLGSIQMATQYDAYDQPFASQLEMLQYEFSSSCATNQNLAHPVECARGDNPLSGLYVRTGISTGDIRFYDLGKTTIAVQGVAANTNVGKIWVTYDITLRKPKLYAGQLAYNALFTDYILGNNPTNSTYFTNSTPVIAPNSTFSLTFPTGTQFAFPTNLQTGLYLVMMQYLCTASSGYDFGATPTVVNGKVGPAPYAVVDTMLPAGSWTSVKSYSSSLPGCSMVLIFTVAITAQGCVVNIDPSSTNTLPATAIRGQLTIFQINSNFQ